VSHICSPNKHRDRSCEEPELHEDGRLVPINVLVEELAFAKSNDSHSRAFHAR